MYNFVLGALICIFGVTFAKIDVFYFEVHEIRHGVPIILPVYAQEIKLKINGSLHESSFAFLKKLKHLTILNSQIDFINGKAFNTLQDLESLSLVNNKGDIKITNKFWRKLEKLKEIIFASNQNLDFKPEALENLKNLEILHVDRQNFTLFSKYVKNCTKLKYLHLTNGTLKKIKNDIFNFKNLEIIKLINLEIEHIENDAFKNVPKLKEISLAKNRLKIISGSEFFETSLLKILDLQQNLINNIDINLILVKLPVLEEINLNSNKFSCRQKLEIEKLLKSKKIISFHNFELDKCSFKGAIFSSP